tara:strand:- start:160 stop:753 length:594 start_codon:yes stop_codon:yes gene_type:complete
MTTILTKKFTKLRKELQYWQSELEYIQEVLKEWHYKFEEWKDEYCLKNNIDLDKLNRENTETVNEIFQNSITTTKAKIDFKTNKKKKAMNKIYKKLAKKLHPDIGGDEKVFKEITSAMSENNFEKILDISEKHDILLEIDEEMIELLEKQILSTKSKIDKEKSTYSWKLFSCGKNQLCKNQLMDAFLRHLFNYRGKK